MNELLRTLAPTLASALLGPLGGVAVTALGSLFNIDNATVATVSKVFQDGKLTPEQLSGIKELEMKYKADEAERGFRYADLEFKDRDSARQMQMSTHSTTPTVLTYMITTGFFAILGLMLYDDTVVNSPPLLIMLGSLGTAWTGCVSYWFGTTSGSIAKSNLLAQATPIK
jgi:hypothetical protein